MKKGNFTNQMIQKIYFTSILFFLILTKPLLSQSISGLVLQYENKEPVWFANVVLIHDSSFEKSNSYFDGVSLDSTGYFEFNNIPYDTVTLAITFPGLSRLYIENIVVVNEIELDSIFLISVPTYREISYVNLSHKQIKQRQKKENRDYKKFKKRFRFEDFYIQKKSGKGYFMKATDKEYEYKVDYDEFK